MLTICTLSASPIFAQQVNVLTPSEYVADAMGRYTGKVVGGIGALRAEAASFERRIGSARANFTKCYPNCDDKVIKNLITILWEKDLYYFNKETINSASLLFGTGPQADYWQRATNDYFAGLRGREPDGGLDLRCKRLFENWIWAFMKAMPKNDAAANLNANIRKNALLKTKNNYIPYLQCRDNLEITRAQKAKAFLN